MNSPTSSPLNSALSAMLDRNRMSSMLLVVDNATTPTDDLVNRALNLSRGTQQGQQQQASRPQIGTRNMIINDALSVVRGDSRESISAIRRGRGGSGTSDTSLSPAVQAQQGPLRNGTRRRDKILSFADQHKHSRWNASPTPNQTTCTMPPMRQRPLTLEEPRRHADSSRSPQKNNEWDGIAAVLNSPGRGGPDDERVLCGRRHQTLDMPIQQPVFGAKEDIALFKKL